MCSGYELSTYEVRPIVTLPTFEVPTTDLRRPLLPHYEVRTNSLAALPRLCFQRFRSAANQSLTLLNLVACG